MNFGKFLLGAPVNHVQSDAERCSRLSPLTRYYVSFGVCSPVAVTH